MEERKILVMDKYEQGVIINALNNFRSHLIKENRATDVVNEVLVKVIEAPCKKGKVRDSHESR